MLRSQSEKLRLNLSSNLHILYFLNFSFYNFSVLINGNINKRLTGIFQTEDLEVSLHEYWDGARDIVPKINSRKTNIIQS